MRILVQIGEDEQAFDFRQKEVIVGSVSSSDISLMYEGVGEQHLRIIENNGDYFVEDLNSGYPTFMNDKKLPPQKVFPFNSFFPLELGGIIISLSDEQVPEIPPDVPDVPMEDDVVEQINQKFEQEQAGDRDKFKPNLYEDNSGTSEFKINRQSTKRRRKKLSKNTGIKAGKKRKRPSAKKINVTSNFQRFSLSTIAVVGFLLFLSSYIFYKKHYSNIIKKMSKPVTTSLKNDYRVLNSGIDFIDQKNTMLTRLVNQGLGCQVNEDFCKHFGPVDGWQESEGIVMDEKDMYIFFTKDKLSSLSPVLAYQPGEQDDVDEYVKTNYADIFSLEEFTNNGRKAPVASYQFPADDYEFHMLFLAKLLDPAVQDSLQVVNPQKIFFFVTTNEGKSINVYNYVMLPLSSSVFNSTLYDQIIFEFRISYNSFLTLKLQEIMARVAQTSFNEFNPSESQAYFNEKKMQEYQSVVEMEGCNTELLQILCDDLSAYPSSGRHRVAADGQTLYVVVNTDDIVNQNRARFAENYTDEEIKSLMNIYRKVNRKRGYNYKQFKWNGYVEDRLEIKDIQSNAVAGVLLESTLVDQFNSNEEYNELVVVGEESGGIHTVLSFTRDKVKDVDTEKYRQDAKYFWKSNLPVYERFLRKVPSDFLNI